MKILNIFILSIIFSLPCFSAIKVNGAGASFPFPIYSKWFAEYEKINKDVNFNYQAIGSRGGIEQLIKNNIHFGASDSPVSKLTMSVKHIPTIIGAVAVAYNVQEFSGELMLTGEVLSQIYMGKIKKWNDKEIAKLNPQLMLPKLDIIVIRRNDNSGTSSIFSEYLSAVNPQWKKEMSIEKPAQWPNGVDATGNDGVTAMIKQTNGSIGYIEFSYAIKNKLNTLSLRNKSGNYTKPTIASISASAKSIKTFSQNMNMSLINSPITNAYPITSFTYFILPEQTGNIDQIKEVNKFLDWALSSGQKLAPTLHYAPLPENLAKSIRSQLEL